MIKQYDRNHINRIKNFDITLDSDYKVIEKALEVLSKMCVASIDEPNTSFYVDTDDDGCIILEQNI